MEMAYRQKGGPWGTGHGWYGGFGEAGRRGRRPLRGGLSIEGQSWKKADSYPLPPDERQRKEELVHSVKNNPRSTRLRVGSHSGSADHSAAPPYRPPLLLFLFWTVHGPFSHFLLEEKEKMGGAMNQPSSWLNPPPPARASTIPPLAKAKIYDIIYHPYEITEIR